MVRAFAEIAFTPDVRKAQDRLGSAESYDRLLAPDAARADRLGPKETAFVAERDGFYQATISSSGWPYVQFRGGPKGFLKVVDEQTLAYADFRGNRQYLSSGNLLGDDRVSLILMDYPNRRRLKVWGRALQVEALDDPDLVARLHDPAYQALSERAVVIAIHALDWNCPQHIPRRLTSEEWGAESAALHEQIAELTRENERLKAASG